MIRVPRGGFTVRVWGWQIRSVTATLSLTTHAQTDVPGDVGSGLPRCISQAFRTSLPCLADSYLLSKAPQEGRIILTHTQVAADSPAQSFGAPHQEHGWSCSFSRARMVVFMFAAERVHKAHGWWDPAQVQIVRCPITITHSHMCLTLRTTASSHTQPHVPDTANYSTSTSHHQTPDPRVPQDLQSQRVMEERAHKCLLLTPKHLSLTPLPLTPSWDVQCTRALPA